MIDFIFGVATGLFIAYVILNVAVRSFIKRLSKELEEEKASDNDDATRARVEEVNGIFC